MFGYVYKTTCLINNKFYVGKHEAESFDKYYYGSGIKLKNAIKKYGKKNFIVEIICWCKDLNELNNKETYWIDKLDAKNPKIGYNIADGGDGGDLISNNPNKEDIMKRVSEGLKKFNKEHPDHIKGEKNGMYGRGYLVAGEKNGMYKKHHDDETLKKMSAASKAHWQDPEYRAKLTGENAPSFGRTGEKHPMFGKHHSEEKRKQIAQTTRDTKAINIFVSGRIPKFKYFY